MRSEQQGNVAVITGGADGIGLGIARRCSSEGARVVIADVDSAKVEEEARRHRFDGVPCDVCDDGDIAKLVATAEPLGDVALVVANAGVAVGGRFEQIPTAEWQRLFDVNVTGAVRTIQAFLPGMLKRRRGRIVITGSSAGLFTSAGMDAPYTASKFALRGMAHALANYCKPSGLEVHYLAPRLTDTAFPKTAVAWGRKGRQVTADRELGDAFDTVDDVVEALFNGMQAGEFLISLTPDTRARLAQYPDDPLRVM